MYNPEEPIQIIGYSLKRGASVEDVIQVEESLTEINQRLKVSNRLEELQQRVDKAIKEIRKELEENNHLSYGVALSIIGILNNYEDISNDVQKHLPNHTHKCELKMINGEYAKCPLGVNNFDMGDEDVCDTCKHMRVVYLNQDGDVITSILSTEGN